MRNLKFVEQQPASINTLAHINVSESGLKSGEFEKSNAARPSLKTQQIPPKNGAISKMCKLLFCFWPTKKFKLFLVTLGTLFLLLFRFTLIWVYKEDLTR
jgi:hypothetical protein